MKLLTYKSHPVINLDEICSMKIVRDTLVQGRYRDHSILFTFHNNAERWKMESEEETSAIYTEIVNGILYGNAHIILGD